MKDIIVKSDLSKVFEIAMYFQDNTFLAIVQTREYCLQSLIGNAGGYVGLLLGYSILQLPDFFITIKQWICYLKFWTVRPVGQEIDLKAIKLV